MNSYFPPGAPGSAAAAYNTIGSGTGWSAMARLVREIDEQKIQNYKDDIDTILVFAGLFSAVMTAFLVESYHNLSQDPSQVMILLIQQLTTQTHSYALNAGFLNSTSPPFAGIPKFTPSTNAIRVNVLWFASLTLSLVSASFSILVKQWLQEYLAGEYTSAQARIRIRHFRYPGLDDWKVFEIAAALPLLLQLSLALFFVGLCFFTADVHGSVGHTTLPLVAAWGFLFIMVSLAPALSPRCPYKTRLLKTLMQAWRKQIVEIVLWVKGLSLEDIKPLAEISSKWSYQLLAYDETDAAKSDANDIDIFISVDSIQTDEQLLKAMWDALQQTKLQFPEAYTFITKVIEHRSTGRRTTVTPAFADPHHTLNLVRLPRQSASFIMAMTSEILTKEVERLPLGTTGLVPEWSPEMKGCLYLLLSETEVDIPGAVQRLFLFLLSDEQHRKPLFNAFASLAKTHQAPNSFLHALSRFGPAIALADGDSLLNILAGLMRSYFCSAAEHNHDALIDVILSHSEIPVENISAVVKLVTLLGKKAIVTSEKVQPGWTTHLGIFLFQLYSIGGADSYHGDILGYVRFFLTSWQNISGIFNPMFAMDKPHYNAVRKSAREAAIRATVTAAPSEIADILDSFVVFAVRHANRVVFSQDEDTAPDQERMVPLHASLVFLRLLEALREDGKDLIQYANPIRRFCDAIAEGLETVAGMHHLWEEDYGSSAKHCLELVHNLDILQSPGFDHGHDSDAFVQWAVDSSLDYRNSLFSDAFVWNIASYLSAEESDLCSPRVRRMRLVQAKSPGPSAALAKETTISLLKLLQHRAQQQDIRSSFLDLTLASDKTATTAMSMATSILKGEIGRQLEMASSPDADVDWSPWMEDCLYILFSYTASPIPEITGELFSTELNVNSVRRTKAFFAAVTARVAGAGSLSFSHVLERLRTALAGEYLLPNLKFLLQHYFCPPLDTKHGHELLYNIIADHTEISSQHVITLVDLVSSLVKDAVISSEKTQPSWTSDARIFLMQLWPVEAARQCRTPIQGLARFFLSSWKHSAGIFNFMFGIHHTYDPQVRESACEAAIEATITSTHADMTEILDNFRECASQHARSGVYTEEEITPGHANRIDPLNASLVFLRLLHRLRENGTSLEEHKSVIGEFFKAVGKGVETVADMQQLWKGDYHTSAKRCLELVDRLDVSHPPPDEDRAAFSEWAKDFPLDDSLVSDSFIEKVALYLEPEDALVSHRIRRLRFLQGDTPGKNPAAIASTFLLPDNGNPARLRSRSPSPSSISHSRTVGSESSRERGQSRLDIVDGADTQQEAIIGAGPR